MSCHSCIWICIRIWICIGQFCTTSPNISFVGILLGWPFKTPKSLGWIPTVTIPNPGRQFQISKWVEKVKVAITTDDCKSVLFIWYTQGSFAPRFIYFMLYLKNDPNNFILVLKLNYVKKISRGGWSGFGMETVGIHPNDFGVLNGHPNKIPTNEMLGGVV